MYMVVFIFCVIWLLLVVTWSNERRAILRLKPLLEAQGRDFSVGIHQFIEALFWNNLRYQALRPSNDREVFEFYHYWWFLPREKAKVGVLPGVLLAITVAVGLASRVLVSNTHYFTVVMLGGLALNGITGLLIVRSLLNGRKIYQEIDTKCLSAWRTTQVQSEPGVGSPPSAGQLSPKDQQIMLPVLDRRQLIDSQPAPFLAQSKQSTILVVALLFALGAMVTLPLLIGLPLGERAFPAVVWAALVQVPVTWMVLFTLWARRSQRWQASHPMM